MLFATCAAIVGCSSASESASDEPFPETPLTTISSDAAGLVIEVRTSPNLPSRGTNKIELTVTDGAHVLRDGLTIQATTYMPEMGHGAAVVPSVAAGGSGKYVVSNVDLFMPGRWELRTTIGGSVEDHATILFQIP